MADTKPVEVTIKVQTGTSAADLARVTAASGALAKAMSHVGDTGVQGAVGIKQIAVGAFLGNAAFRALEIGADLARHAIRSLAEFVRDSVASANASDEAIKRLNQTLLQTGQYSGEYSRELQGLATQFQRTTRFSDEMILASARQLVAFGATRQQIPGLLQSVSDLAEGLGVDLSGATMLVSKALAGSTGALSRYGIHVTEGATRAQKLVEIQTQLNARFGGQAAAALDTFGGSLTRIANLYDDLKEAVGRSITQNETVRTVLASLTQVLDVAGTSSEALTERLDTFVTDALTELLQVLPRIIDGVVVFGATVVSLAKLLVSAVASVDDWGASLKQMGLLLGIIIPAVIAFGAALAAVASGGSLIVFESFVAGAIGVSAKLGLTLYGVGAALEGLGERAQTSTAGLDPLVAALKEAAGDASSATQEFQSFNRELAHMGEAAKRSQTEPGMTVVTPESETFVAAVQQMTAQGIPLSRANLALAATFGAITEKVKIGGPPLRERGEILKGAAADTQKAITLARAEAEARIQAISVCATQAQTEALIEAQKARALGVSEQQVQALYAETLAKAEAVDQTKKLAEAQTQLQNLTKDVADLGARKVMFDGLVVSGASWLEIQRAMAIEDEVAKDASGRLTEQIRAEAAQRYDLAKSYADEKAAQESLNDVQTQINAAQKQIDINEKLIAGEIDLAEAVRQRAVEEEKARRAAAGMPALTQDQIDAYRKLADTQDTLAKSAQRAADATFNVGKSFADNIAKVIEGIALGTNKGMSLMQGLAQAVKATWASMLASMIKSKLGFDSNISANFLRDIPGIINRGLSLIRGDWSAALSGIAGETQQQASPSGGGIAQNLSTIVSIGKAAWSLVGGLFGGAGAVGGLMGGISASGAVASGLGVPVAIESLSPAVASVFAASSAADAMLVAEAGITAAEATTALGPTAGAVGAVGGGIGVGTGAATGGILLGAVAVIMSAMAATDAARKRDSFFSLGQQREMIVESFGPVMKGIGNIVSYAMVGQSANNAFAANQRVLYGKPGTLDVMTTIASVLLNPNTFFMALAAGRPAPRGTVARRSAEKYLYEPENEIPFFAGTAYYDRKIGQEETRQWAQEHPMPESVTGKWDAKWAYNERGWSNTQSSILKLMTKQDQLFTGFALAFRGLLGSQAGGVDQVGSVQGIRGSYLGSLVKHGASQAEALASVTVAIEKLGSPFEVFRKTNEQLERGAILVDDYAYGIQGLATVYEKDVPLGVRAGEQALKMFIDANKGALEGDIDLKAKAAAMMSGAAVSAADLQRMVDKIKESGEAVGVEFGDLDARIKEVSASAMLLVPPLQEIFKIALMDTEKSLSAAGLGTQVFQGIIDQLKGAVAQAFGDGIIQAGLNADILQPFLHAMADTMTKLSAGELTTGEASSIMKQALIDAKASIKQLQPFIAELISAGQEMSDVFDEAEDSVLSLATSIAQLEMAQRAFNDSMDARIFAMRNQGQASPEIIRRGLPDIEREYKLTLKEFFPGPEDLQTGHTLTEQMNAITRLTALAEQYLATQVAAIEAERDAAIAMHQENINALQREREAIQENFAAQIEARQTELEAVQKAAQVAAAWKGVMDQISQTILAMRTGASSPEAPLSRLGIAQEEFARQQAILRDRGASDTARQAAAQQMTALGPQIVDLMNQAGIAQSSEQYRIAFAAMLSALDEANAMAAEKGAQAEALQARAVELQEEIANLQKEQTAALKGIDERIKDEQDAIVAAQERAKAEIIRVNESMANVIQSLRDMGNNIFAAKQDELKAKLAALGVTSVDMADIQADSLIQLYRIADLIEGQGSTVKRTVPGQFGLSSASQAAIKGNIESGGIDREALAALDAWLAAGFARDQMTGQAGRYYDLIAEAFPEADTVAQIRAVVRAFRLKIEHPEVFQPVLGFAHGGIVQHETLARLAEANRAELIVPLNPAERSVETQRAFVSMARREFGGRFGARPLDATRPLPAMREEASVGTRSGTAGGVVQQSVTINLTVQVQATVDLTDKRKLQAQLTPVFTDMLTTALTKATMQAKIAKVARVGIAAAPRL